MKRINRETDVTIIIVTHNIEVAYETDRTIYLRDGVIVEEELRR